MGVTKHLFYGFTIYGEGGEDVIQGGNGNDIILGGPGGDEIKGGDGNDWIKGGDHKDHIEGGPGNDVIYGNGAEDTLRGGAGNDLIDGGNGEDKIWGEDGEDQLYGEAGNDQIRGGNGNDLIRGGSGDDKIRGDSGSDVLLGENGNDEKEDSSSVSADDYEDDRKAKMNSIKNDFGVGVIDFGRKWTTDELEFLRTALKKMPDKVFDMWKSLGGKVKYHRKEVCQLKSTDEYTASGLTSTGIYLYDLNWANNTSNVEKKQSLTLSV